MKILFLTRLYYPHIGGVEKHIEEVSKILIKKGCKITVVTTKHDEALSYSDTVHGIKVIRFKQPNIKYIGLIYTWYWFIRNINLIKESDIIHIHDVFIWYWPFRIIFPKKKVYITYHGRWGKYPIPKVDIIQKRIGARFSDGVISIGDYIDKNYGIKSDVISYGAASIPIRKVKKDNKLIVYVGRLDEDIALQTFFEALKIIKDYKIIFCGEGKLSYEANLYGDVKGFVDPEPYLRAAKYCFASGYLTIMEALANRCLVFTAYNNPLQKDYYELTPFKKYIISTLNPVQLLKYFKYYNNHTEMTNKIIERGYEWVKLQSWEKLVDLYLKLWNIA